MKKVLLEAPILTQSGYGEHARLVFSAIRKDPELEIFIDPLDWGTCSWEAPDKEIKKCIDRQKGYLLQCQQEKKNPEYSAQIRVGIPNEFEKKAPYSVCVTAGIETDRVSLNWLLKTHQGIDKIIVPSEHARKGFVETGYRVQNKQNGTETNIHCACQVDVISYPVKEIEPDPLEIDFKTDFNFLQIAMIGPRKNLQQSIKCFVEEFRENSDVGLILKTSTSKSSIIDRLRTKSNLENYINSLGEKKCKIYLLHGNLSEGQIHSLYTHPKVKAYFTTTHGEGYGLPIFEAAYSGLPIVATDWSGHLDFLSAEHKGKKKKLFAKILFDLKEVQPQAVWGDLILKESKWAFPKDVSVRSQLAKVYKDYGMYKSWAKSLKSHLKESYKKEKILKQYRVSLFGEKEETALEQLETVPKISVITSVYDGDEYIDDFLKDIEAQTIFKEKVELILINANSPGNEEETILRFRDKYPDNVVYVKLDDDPGIYACWNEAIRKSTGQLITNANLDDRHSPQFMHELASVLVQDSSIDVVYADNLLTRQPNETWDNNSAVSSYPSENFSKEAMLRGNPPHCMPMWRKSLHERHGFFEEKYRSASDWEFWLRCTLEGVEMKKINKPLGLYYFNPKGMSTNQEHNEWKRKEEREIFSKYMNAFKERA